MTSQDRYLSVDDDPPIDLDSLRVVEGVRNLPVKMIQRLGGVIPASVAPVGQGDAGGTRGQQDTQASPSQLENPVCESPQGDENEVETEPVVLRPRRKNSAQLRRIRFSSSHSSNMTIDEEKLSDGENPGVDTFESWSKSTDNGCTGRSRLTRGENGPRSADWVDRHRPQCASLWRSNSTPLMGSAPDVISFHRRPSNLQSRSPDLLPESQEDFAARGPDNDFSAASEKACCDTDRRLIFEGPVSWKKRRQQYKSSGYGTGESDKNSQVGSQCSSSALSDSVMEEEGSDSFAGQENCNGIEMADSTLSDSTISGGTMEHLPRFCDLISLKSSSEKTVEALDSHRDGYSSQGLINPAAVTRLDPESEGQELPKDPEHLPQDTDKNRMDPAAGLPHLSIFDDHSVEMPCELPSVEGMPFDGKSSSQSSDENDTASAQATAILNEHMEKTLSGERLVYDPQPPKASPRQRESEGRQHYGNIIMELLKEGFDPHECLELLHAIYNGSPSPREPDQVCPCYDFCAPQVYEERQQLYGKFAREVEGRRRLGTGTLVPGNQINLHPGRHSQVLQQVPAQQGKLALPLPHSQLGSGSVQEGAFLHQRVHHGARTSPSEDMDPEEERLERSLELCHSLERAARCDLLACTELRCLEARKLLQDFKDHVLREPHRSHLVVEVLLALRLHSERCEALKCPVFACSFLQDINPWHHGAAVRQISNELQTPFLRLTDSSGQDSSYLQIDSSEEYRRPIREGEDWIVLFNLKESKDVVVAEIVSSNMMPSHHMVIKKAALHEGNGQWQVMERLRKLQRDGGGIAVAHHYWALQTNSSLLVCSHFHPDGTLRELLDTRKGELDLVTVLRLILEVVKGVMALNSVDIIYLNWTSSNVLLENGGQRVRVSNFTSSVPLGLQSESGDGFSIGDIKMSLPPPIIPPELLRSPDQPLTLKADSWGCGCLLYELLEGKMVWHNLRHEDREDIWRKMRECAYKVSPPPARDLKSLFDRCWKVKPQERCSLTRIQAMLWDLTLPDHQPVLVCVDSSG